MTEESGTSRVHEILQHGLAYLQRGWWLVAIPDGSKAPRTEDWNTVSELIDTPDKLVDRLARGAINIGLYHKESMTVAFDVDHEPLTRVMFEEFGLDYQAIVGAGMRIWSREGRDKVLFRCGVDDLHLTKINWPQKENPSKVFTLFELRGGNCQDVLPPSIHPETKQPYRWYEGAEPWSFEGDLPMIPADLLEFWLKLQDRDSGLREEISNACPWKVKHEGRRYTQKARAAPKSGNDDVVGQFNAANDIGAMLESAGYKRKGRRYLAPSSSTTIPGVVVLGDKCYSHHGSDILADGYAHDAFDLLVMLHHSGDFRAAVKDAAGQLGIGREGRADVDADGVIDMSAVMAAQEKRAAVVRDSRTENEPAISAYVGGSGGGADQLYPARLLSPPGMVGRVARWILETAYLPQPVMAVAGAFTLLGTVLGRKVALEMQAARSNLYFVCLAHSGFGKEHVRNCIKQALKDAVLTDLISGEEIASATGLLNSARARPVGVFLMDEMGAWLAALASKNASGHEKAIPEALKKLFSSTTQEMGGTAYADQKMNPLKPIPYPVISLYGTTTPGVFYSSITPEAIAGGFLNRLMVLEAPDLPPTEQEEANLWGTPGAITEWLKAARAIYPGIVDDGSQPLRIPLAPMAKTLLTNFTAELRAKAISMRSDPAKAGLVDLWARAREHAMKLALVLSIGMEEDATRLAALGASRHIEIDSMSMGWAIEFVRFTTERTEIAAATRMGSGDAEKLAQAILHILVDKPHDVDGGCLESHLSKASRLFKGKTGQERDVAFDMLRRDGSAFSAKLGVGGSVRWYAAGRVPGTAIRVVERDKRDSEKSLAKMN